MVCPIAATLTVVCFVMLCQSFPDALFVVGFPFLLAGVVPFMILDRVPDAWPREEEENLG